jgi:pyridoxine/pyridoxamine 5'-phosphate oxidase
MSSQDYKDYRREYEAQGLRRQELALDPWQQFSHWLSEAEVACPLDATSMSLATVSASGMPSARMVLMKSYDNNGLVWYTDSRSYKGQDIAHNPQASVLFYWQPLERQVRISGTVTMVSDAIANDYFAKWCRALRSLNATWLCSISKPKPPRSSGLRLGWASAFSQLSLSFGKASPVVCTIVLDTSKLDMIGL